MYMIRFVHYKECDEAEHVNVNQWLKNLCRTKRAGTHSFLSITGNLINI